MLDHRRCSADDAGAALNHANHATGCSSSLSAFARYTLYKATLKRSLSWLHCLCFYHVELPNGVRYLYVRNWSVDCKSNLSVNSGADSIGHGGSTVNRRTANKKLSELYWTSWKRSPKLLIVAFLLSQKSGGARPTKFFRRFAAHVCSLLSNSFRRHCKLYMRATENARSDNSAPYRKGGHRETCFSVRVLTTSLFDSGSIIWAAHGF